MKIRGSGSQNDFMNDFKMSCADGCSCWGLEVGCVEFSHHLSVRWLSIEVNVTCLWWIKLVASKRDAAPVIPFAFRPKEVPA